MSGLSKLPGSRARNYCENDILFQISRSCINITLIIFDDVIIVTDCVNMLDKKKI